MGKMLKLMAVFLAIGTVVLTIAVVYVTGVEQGVNSQQPEIAELYKKLNPDVLIDWLPYMHPLRNFLFGSTLFIGICWIAFLLTRALLWEKVKPIVEGRRKELNPTTYKPFEYLYNELKKRQQKLQSQA